MKRSRRLLIVLLAMAMLIAAPVTAMAANYVKATLSTTAGFTEGTTKDAQGTWKKNSSGYYFLLKDGKRAVGWLKVGTKKYYLKKNTYRASGLTQIGAKKFYFNKTTGAKVEGFVTIYGGRYYFDSSLDGAMFTGTSRVIGTKRWYFNSKGKAIRSVKITKTVPKTPKNGYDSEGNFYDSKGHRIRKSTIKALLQTAMKPVGSTMYIYGGGWGVSETTTIGVSSRWKTFFNKQTKNYSHWRHAYQAHNGLDCSGYVGWTLYNTFNTESGHGSFVMLALVMASTYAKWGWGSFTRASKVTNHHAGDIMSLPGGHVYITIGQCSDGSVVLVHSSPCGVQITGTATRRGSTNSQAIKLARKYMKKYFPAWYRKYPKVSRGSSYLTSYNRMRWYLSGTKSVMTDPDGYTSMSAAQVLRDLLGPA